jgi:uncharacterized protein YbcI
MSDLASDFRAAGASGQRGDGGATMLSIANAVVRVHKRYFGKGPTRARAYHHGEVITCVLRDCFTRAEQTLLERGHHEAVHEHRQRLQRGVREEFTEAIEEITGRQVVGFFSGSQTDPDMSVVVFVLAPTDGEV